MMAKTPIRVRGKRGASNAEKWHAGKQRKALRSESLTPSERSSNAQSSSSASNTSRRRRRKQREPELSMLERLPTEILQQIFEYSVNLELPRVSTRIQSQLATTHLHYQLTSRILQSILGDPFALHEAELENAMRLMNSRFFTWTFFQEWLGAESERRKLSERPDAPGDTTFLKPHFKQKWIWTKLMPSVGLLPPRKLWRAPFEPGKVQFLDVIMSCNLDTPSKADATYIEHVREGLQQAVSDGAWDSLGFFWNFDVRPDAELLREAVIDAGCDKRVVEELVHRVKWLSTKDTGVDFLDPKLWRWADEARARGDEKGDWLIELLKDAARVVDHKVNAQESDEVDSDVYT